MKSLYSTLALLLAVLGGGAWIYFNERTPVAAPQSTVLLRSDPARVETLSIVHDSGERIAFFKTASGWKVSREGATPNKIGEVPADEKSVEALFSALQLVQSAAPLKEPSRDELRAYGLLRPMSTLLLSGAKIEFGNTPGFDRRQAYARVTSEQTPASRVALLPVGLAQAVLLPFDSWRDKSVLRIASPDINQLEIQTPTLRARFERLKKGEASAASVQPDEWQMIAPLNARADFGPLRALLDALPSTLAARFLNDAPKNLAAYGLDKPAFSVRVTAGKSVSTLRIGKVVSGGRAAQNSLSPAVFVLPESFLKHLNLPLRTWRGKRVLYFEVAKVDAFSLRARGKTVSFARDQNDPDLRWTQTSGATKNSSPDAVAAVARDVLFSLKDFATIDFIDKPAAPSTYGFDRPTLQFDLQAVSWPRGVTIQIGEKNRKLFARAGQGSASTRFASPVYVLPPDALEELKPALGALFPEPKKKVRGVR